MGYIDPFAADHRSRLKRISKGVVMQKVDKQSVLSQLKSIRDDFKTAIDWTWEKDDSFGNTLMYYDEVRYYLERDNKRVTQAIQAVEKGDETRARDLLRRVSRNRNDAVEELTELGQSWYRIFGKHTRELTDNTQIAKKVDAVLKLV